MKADTTEPWLDSEGKQITLVGFPCVINHNMRVELEREAEECRIQEAVSALLLKTLGHPKPAGDETREQ